MQGKITEAEILCQEALKTFQTLGDHSGEALALNTLGLIQVEGQQYEIGQKRCQRALEVSQAYANRRDMGLACIGLGISLRRTASRDVYFPKETLVFFRDAEHYLRQASHLFETSVPEPLRRVEAYKELGCTYRDWVVFQRQRGDSSTDAERIERLALDSLQQSHDLAKQIGLLVDQVDALEDIARVHFNRREHEKTNELLDSAESLVPQQYLIRAHMGLPVVAEPIAPFWSVLGKTSLLRGHIAFEEGQIKDGAKFYTLASAYFRLYAENTALADCAVRSAYPRVRSLPPDDITDWRRVASHYEQKYHLGRTRLMQVLDETLGSI